MYLDSFQFPSWPNHLVLSWSVPNWSFSWTFSNSIVVLLSFLHRYDKACIFARKKDACSRTSFSIFQLLFFVIHRVLFDTVRHHGGRVREKEILLFLDHDHVLSSNPSTNMSSDIDTDPWRKDNSKAWRVFNFLGDTGAERPPDIEHDQWDCPWDDSWSCGFEIFKLSWD